MGLRQLYFLIGDLLKRLVYLSYGLAFLLAFIGVKLVLHALHENEVPFINGGEHVSWAPGVPIPGSPGVSGVRLADRKRVALGKIVDLGGRRFIKKKTSLSTLPV